MPQYSRFCDLREPQLAWDLPSAHVESSITTPNGDELYSVTLPSPCADFLILEDTRIWAGVTVAFLPSHMDIMRSLFDLTNASIVRFISPAEAKLLSRYQNLPERGWLEVTWVRDKELHMIPAQTSGALWYCKNEEDEKQHVVVLALEGVDRMRAEVEGGLIVPGI
jgi:hypothetical protein